MKTYFFLIFLIIVITVFLVLNYYGYLKTVNIGLETIKSKLYNKSITDCMFSICRNQNTLEYCFNIKTECRQLLEKCTDKPYLSQWGLNCYWLNITDEVGCKCTLNMTMI